MTTEVEIIDAIRDLASKNYDKSYGWQVIIECMNDEDILVAAGDVLDMKSAIRNIEQFVEIQDERYDDVMAEAF
jgi:hypothetical protein